MRNGGGIADAMNVVDADTAGASFYAKTSFNLIFFIMVNVVMLNIIFGLIIDGFASLRDSDTEKSKF